MKTCKMCSNLTPDKRTYCSNKCKKNALKLRRDRRKLKWTEAYGIVKSKAVEKQRVKDEKEKSEKKSAENKAEVKK